MTNSDYNNIIISKIEADTPPLNEMIFYQICPQ